MRPFYVGAIYASWHEDIVFGAGVSLAQAEQNMTAINECIDLASQLGVGVRINPSALVTEDGQDPELLVVANHAGAASLLIMDGVTLSGEGMFLPGLRWHDEALDGSVNTDSSGVKFDAICKRAAIRDLQIDGNIGGQVNFAAITANWLSENNMAASANVHGVFWSDMETGGELTLTNVWSHDWLRCCFIGREIAVQATNCLAGNALTDHLLYVTTGEKHPVVSAWANFHGYGYWRGPAIDVAGADVLGIVVNEIAPNPCLTLTGTNFMELISVLSNRPAWRGSQLQGVVQGPLDLVVDAIVAPRGPGNQYDVIIEETSPGAYGDTNSPALIGPAGEQQGRFCSGTLVRVAARNIAGKMVVYDGLQPAHGSRFVISARYNGDQMDQGADPDTVPAAIRIREVCADLEFDLDVLRAPGGGGALRLLKYEHAAGVHVGRIVLKGHFENNPGFSWLDGMTAAGTFDPPIADGLTVNYDDEVVPPAVDTSIQNALYARRPQFLKKEFSKVDSSTQQSDLSKAKYKLDVGLQTGDPIPTHVIITGVDDMGGNSLMIDNATVESVDGTPEGTEITVYYHEGDQPADLQMLTWNWEVQTRVPYLGENDGTYEAMGDNTTGQVFRIPHGLAQEPVEFAAIALTEQAQLRHNVTADAEDIIIDYGSATPDGELKWKWMARVGGSVLSA